MDKRTILHNSARVVFIGASAAILLAFLELGAHVLDASLIGHASGVTPPRQPVHCSRQAGAEFLGC